MGSINERNLMLLDKLTERGKDDRAEDASYANDAELWNLAHGIEPELYPPVGFTQIEVADLREAYDEGFKPHLISLDRLAADLRSRGIDAVVLYDCGGGYLLHVGPLFPDSEGGERPAITAGPGYNFGRDGTLANVDEFTFGTVDPTVDSGYRLTGEPMQIKAVADRIVAALDAELAHRGYDTKAYAAHDAEVLQRTDAAVQEGTDAFWAAIAGAFPEITSGDMDPGAVMRLEHAMRSAVASWLDGNQPDGTWTQHPAGPTFADDDPATDPESNTGECGDCGANDKTCCDCTVWQCTAWIGDGGDPEFGDTCDQENQAADTKCGSCGTARP